MAYSLRTRWPEMVASLAWRWPGGRSQGVVARGWCVVARRRPGGRRPTAREQAREQPLPLAREQGAREPGSQGAGATT